MKIHWNVKIWWTQKSLCNINPRRIIHLFTILDTFQKEMEKKFDIVREKEKNVNTEINKKKKKYII
jgi:hypothetical protein